MPRRASCKTGVDLRAGGSRPPRILQRLRGRKQLVALAAQNDPVRAFLLIHVEPLAVVAPHALSLDDFRTSNRAPFARLLADLARLAFGPALDAEDGEVRDDAECRADRAEEAAIEVADKDRCKKQQAD